MMIFGVMWMGWWRLQIVIFRVLSTSTRIKYNLKCSIL